MAQGFIAGMTSYENQSLQNIVDDIINWIEYSEDTKKAITNKYSELKNSEFYKNISYDYKAMINEMPMICQTNIDDLRRTLQLIQNNAITCQSVELFRKVGMRALENSDDNKKCFKSREEGYWHDYGNPEFHVVEDIYAMFGDYCASLWDITNAASRLKDYINIPEEITTMKYENNSINIGNNNKIKKSNFHSKNKELNSQTTKEERKSSKVFWNIFIPIIVGVIVAAICVAFGLK